MCIRDSFITSEIAKQLNVSILLCALSGCSQYNSMVLRAIRQFRPGLFFSYGEVYETAFLSSNVHKDINWDGIKGSLTVEIIITTFALSIFLAISLHFILKFGIQNN